MVVDRSDLKRSLKEIRLQIRYLSASLGCVMAGIDLKDAYYHLPIHAEHQQQYLRVAVILAGQDLGWIVNYEKSRLNPDTIQIFLGIQLDSFFPLKVQKVMVVLVKNIFFLYSKTSNELSGLNPEYQEMMIKCIKSRNPEIKEALVEKVCAMSSSYLQDFDWQLKLAMSSDKLSTLQMPLVNLDLDIVENGAIAPVSIEMNKEELQNLINSLEAANKVCAGLFICPIIPDHLSSSRISAVSRCC
ncbi:unnamed protein product [Ranitomeya imitator]|uniref:COMM domain-containing protein n=1 Tax=Ranitomeya imitator TaxID=111125 RepID=A0ABN9M8W0_9NEOB|nr:unnamed protein product [Ranitomeya imitator]